MRKQQNKNNISYYLLFVRSSSVNKLIRVSVLIRYAIAALHILTWYLYVYRSI